MSGWKGNALVLVLLGFAMTDFVITMTLSAADAAKHAIENPFLHPLLGEHQILLTLVILTVLAIVFLKGFNEAIGLATVAADPIPSSTSSSSGGVRRRSSRTQHCSTIGARRFSPRAKSRW